VSGRTEEMAPGVMKLAPGEQVTGLDGKQCPRSCPAAARPGVLSKTPHEGSERVEVHHLVQADDALSEFHRYRNYWTVCGQVLQMKDLPSSLCECDQGSCFEVVFCLACLREATRHNAERGMSGE
jgi:hypothetical protein